MIHRVLALDPGFSAAGLMVFERRETWVPIAAQAIRPVKDTKKTDARQSLQDAGVIGKIVDGVVEAVTKYGIRYVVAELPDAGAARYSTCRAISISTGWLVCLIHSMKLAHEFYTPADVKVAATGNRMATKRQVTTSVKKLYPIVGTIRYAADREHVADAAGAFLAAKNGQMLRLLEQTARGEGQVCHVPSCAGGCQGAAHG